MKRTTSLIINVCTVIALIAALPGCYKLQKDYNRDPSPIDPHIYKTTWQFIKDRSYGSATDTIFRRMYDAIIYSGIDTNEYIKPGRTFILMNNTAAKALWTSVKTAANVAAVKWNDYPQQAVKNYLYYLILDGVYDHYTLPAVTDVTANTLAPQGAFTTNPTGFTIPAFIANPTSVMKIQVINTSPSNTSDYPIQLNDILNVYTSSILATNGAVHVINGYLTTNIPQ
jgi:hypothetical protein